MASNPKLKAIMEKVGKGPQALQGSLSGALKQAEPAWDTIQPKTKEYAELTAELGKHDPPKGDKESWGKLSLAFADSAAELDKAAQAKDKAKAVGAIDGLQNSCMGCHRQHRGGPTGGPGGMGRASGRIPASGGPRRSRAGPLHRRAAPRPGLLAGRRPVSPSGTIHPSGSSQVEHSREQDDTLVEIILASLCDRFSGSWRPGHTASRKPRTGPAGRKNARGLIPPASTRRFDRRTTSSGTSTAAGSPRPRFRRIVRLTARSSSSETRANRTSERSSRRPRPPTTRRVGSTQDRRSVQELHERGPSREARQEADRSRPRADRRDRGKVGVIPTIASFQREGVTGLFVAFVSNDFKKSDQYILYLNQSGLTLPDEAYYREDKFKPIREKFVAHVEKMFELAGIPEPKAEAAKVMTVETALAKNHWDRVKSRDRTLTYNKMDRKALESLSPGVDWNAWFSTYGDAKIDDVVVRQPDYFKAISKILEETPLADLKAWLKWHVLHDAAPFLSKPFVDENFAFFRKTLTGAPEIRPRWKRGVAARRAGAGRGGRQAVRRQALSARGQGADEGARRQLDRSLS